MEALHPGGSRMKTCLSSSLLSLTLLAAGCDSAPELPTCRVASVLSYAAKFTPSGPAAPPGSTCAQPGQPLAFRPFDEPGATRPSLELEVLGLTGDPGASRAAGQFSRRKPDSNDLCSIPTLSPITRGTLRYTFSNLEVYLFGNNRATQLGAQLTIEDTGAVPCRASYAVLALWPQVACTSDAACGEGSGIHPELFDAVSCDAAIGACMLKGEDFVRLPGDE